MAVHTHRVYQNIDSAAVTQNKCGRLLALRSIGEVAYISAALRCKQLQFALRLAHVALVTACKIYGGSLACKQNGNAFSNAPRGCCDKGPFPLQHTVVIPNSAVVVYCFVDHINTCLSFPGAPNVSISKRCSISSIASCSPRAARSSTSQFMPRYFSASGFVSMKANSSRNIGSLHTGASTSAVV